MTATEQRREFNTKGERLKYIRSLIRQTRAYFQEKYGLPEVTLKSWENGTTNLTQTGAKRCVEIYLNEGVIVSEDWIMEGVGLDPAMSVKVSHYFATPTDKELSGEDDEICMFRDANVFKESHPNIVIMIVSNDDMRPFYKPGDYVGGKMRFGEAVDTVVNKDCVVYLKNGERFFRRLIKSHTSGYNLTCLNPNETTIEPVLYNVEIEGAAPVIWHRRKDD
jgi:hypothetical protein